MKRVSDRFDTQAGVFDERAGLEPAVGQEIAQAVLNIVAAAPDDVLLEIGAGTGEVGRHLAVLPIRYVALDFSGSMLQVFRGKLGDGSAQVPTLQADCEGLWPIENGCIAAVFASRVVHLFKPEHFVDELLRVCRPGGYLLMGRVVRDRQSLKSRLQRQKRRMLAEVGITPRAGSDETQTLFDQCVARGATELPTRMVAEWTGSATAEQVLTWWEAQPAMGGVPLDAEARAALLRQLRDWAMKELGDLHRAEVFTERYTIEGFRFP